MATIRDLFHQIGNKHNKVSISSGVLRESIKRKPLVNLSKGELKERNDKLISSLNEIEKTAIDADKLLNELRTIIYNLIDPDQGISISRKE